MKFTSEDLMKAMGLKVGDRVACLDSRYIFKVIEHKGNVYLECVNAKNETQFIHYLLNVDFEILPAPKRVGDLKCGECSCTTCQLRGIGCRNVSTNTKNTLYEILDKYFEEYPDQEIYDLLMARLDMEVKQDEK